MTTNLIDKLKEIEARSKLLKESITADIGVSPLTLAEKDRDFLLALVGKMRVALEQVDLYGTVNHCDPADYRIVAREALAECDKLASDATKA